MDVAKIIDHTNIRPDATMEEIKKTCQEAKEYGFRGVCVNPEWVRLVGEELNPVRDYKGKKEIQKEQISNGAKGTETSAELSRTPIKVIVLVDPPIGDSSHQERIKICQKAKQDGADELDVVINIPAVKHEKYEEVSADLKEISKILPTKVIIGSGYLTDIEIKKASEIVKEAGAVCVKTSTGKDPLDQPELKEKAKHLKIMRESAPSLEIKAAGSIRTLKDLKMMVDAGADIIGTSSGVDIIKELEK